MKSQDDQFEDSCAFLQDPFIGANLDGELLKMNYGFAVAFRVAVAVLGAPCGQDVA